MSAKRLLEMVRMLGSQPLAARRRRSPRASDALTPAERRVLDQVYLGQTSLEIARALWISEATVRTHLTHIYQKLGVRSRVELLATKPRPAADDTSTPTRAPRSKRSRLGLAPAPVAAGLLVIAAGIAHLSFVTWPVIGPLLIASLLVIPNRVRWASIRAGAAAAGVLLSGEQLLVLVALRASGI